MSTDNNGKFYFSTKKFAIIFFIGMVLVLSCWFYFQGRELDYAKGYSNAIDVCNKYLENKTVTEKASGELSFDFNFTNHYNFS